MSEYKSTAEHAKEIRAALKAAGWKARAFSVRSDNFSMGSSIDVRIKDASIPIAKVEEIVEAHSRISRCEMSGEILSGCNRYTSTSYSHEAEVELREKFEHACAAAIEELNITPESAKHVHIEGTESTIGHANAKGFFGIWHAGVHGKLVTSSTEASYSVAVAALNAEGVA